MSAIPVSAAPVSVTAPIAAPARRAAPVRAENQPAFADVLEEATAPDAPPPAARPRNTDETNSTDTSIETADDTETETNGDTGAPDLAVAPPPPPPPPLVAVAVAVPTPKIEVELSDPVLADEAPAAPVVPAVPGQSVPAEAPVPTAAATPPPPSAAPVVPPVPVSVPVPVPHVDADADADARADGLAAPDDALASDGSLPLLPDTPAAAPRLRDRMEPATSGNAASAQARPDTATTTNATAAGDPGARTATPSSTGPMPSDATPAGTKAATETAPGALASLDATEPPQAPQGTASAEARAAQATAAATPVLSALSQSAIHATAQIAAQIVKKLEGRSTRFEMALTPDDLGRVDVSLDIDADGQLSARLAFDNPLAAADLRGRVDELRRQLTDAGFTVADDALSFDQREASAGNSGFDRGADPQSGRQSARAFGAASRLSLDAEASLVPPRWMSLTLTPERVDMKV